MYAKEFKYFVIERKICQLLTFNPEKMKQRKSLQE